MNIFIDLIPRTCEIPCSTRTLDSGFRGNELDYVIFEKILPRRRNFSSAFKTRHNNH